MKIDQYGMDSMPREVHYAKEPRAKHTKKNIARKANNLALSYRQYCSRQISVNDFRAEIIREMGYFTQEVRKNIFCHDD